MVENNTFFDYSFEDTSKSLELATRYKVMMLPTFLITEEGKEISRVSGYVSAKIMQEFLNKNKE
jgi:thioredoxin-related protein